MVTRQERKRKARRKFLVVGTILIILAAVLCGSYFALTEYAVPASAPGPSGQAPAGLVPPWREILSLGIPGLGAAAEARAPVSVRPEASLQGLVRSAVLFVTGVDVRDARSLLQAEIPFMALVRPGSPSISALSLPDFPKFEWKSITPAGKPLVGIYHTHTAEAFIPNSGRSHKPGGQRGDIVDVGEAMVARLAQHGIPAVQSKNIHDYPSFMKAYGPSEATAKKLLADNPSLQMLFDIHRDADKRENATVMVNGTAMARISIVVGMGQPDLLQPHWQQNHAFAKLIDAKLNQHFPGLSRGIQLVEWRYNQHLHPRALLIEVGCQDNSREEAVRSIELLSDVVTEILSES
jgi:stage II sporulation protein P